MEERDAVLFGGCAGYGGVGPRAACGAFPRVAVRVARGESGGPRVAGGEACE